jgi:hypothetical protein
MSNSLTIKQVVKLLSVESRHNEIRLLNDFKHVMGIENPYLDSYITAVNRSEDVKFKFKKLHVKNRCL